MINKSSFPTGVIKEIEGKCLILRGDDIDTDRIIPARFLKCVSFDSLGEQVFADDRDELKGAHPFDLPRNQGGSILIVNDNFGCGSSREHAPQALMRWGIRGLIGQSFAEIFYGNCLALGIPCATASESIINKIQNDIDSRVNYNGKLLLKEKSFKSELNSWSIHIESGPLEMLTSGRWDVTSQLISQEIALKRTMNSLPYLNHFKY